MGLGVVLTKRWGRPDGVSALALAGWQLTGGGLLLTAPVLIIDGLPTGIDTAALAGYAWLGLVGGLAAYVLWFEGIRQAAGHTDGTAGPALTSERGAPRTRHCR